MQLNVMGHIDAYNKNRIDVFDIGGINNISISLVPLRGYICRNCTLAGHPKLGCPMVSESHPS